MNSPLVRRRLYVVWLLLALLLAGIIVHEVTGVFNPVPPPPTGRLPMFTFHESEVGRVEVMHQGMSTSFMRDTTGAWFHHGASHGQHHQHVSGSHHHSHPEMKSHRPVAALPSTTIKERIELLARMLADRQVTPTQSLDHYGLTNPPTMIAFYGRNAADTSQPFARLYIGDLLSTRYAYYAMRPGDRDLSLVPRYYIAMLLALAFGEDQAPTPLPGQAEMN